MTIPPFVTSKTDYKKFEQSHGSDSSTIYGEVWTRVRETQGDQVKKAVGFADLKTANGHATRKIDWNGVGENAEHHLKLKVQLTDKEQKLTLTSNGKKQVFLLPKKSDVYVDDLNTDGTIELEFREIKGTDGNSFWEIKSSPKKKFDKARSEESAANNNSFMQAYNELNNPTKDKPAQENKNVGGDVNNASPRDVEMEEAELLKIPGDNEKHEVGEAFDGNSNIPKNIKKFASNWKASKAVFDIGDDNKHLGLNATAKNACYIHTGIQLLRMMLPDAEPLAEDKIEETINDLIKKNAKEIGVNDSQFIELLQKPQDERLAKLREIRENNKNEYLNKVASDIAGEIKVLQDILGNNYEEMSPAEKLFILDQMQRIAGHVIKIDSDRKLTNLYGYSDTSLKETILRFLKPKDEKNALKVLCDFNTSLNKLHYLDAVLHVKGGTKAESDLLTHIANNAKLTSCVPTNGEKGDAGEFAAKIIEWHDTFFRSNNEQNDFQEVLKRTEEPEVKESSDKIKEYLEEKSIQNNVRRQNIGHTISAPSTSFPEGEASLSLQKIVNKRFETEANEKSTILKNNRDSTYFKNLEKPAFNWDKGLSKAPELFCLRIDRRTHSKDPDTPERDCRSFDLGNLDDLSLELPIYSEDDKENNNFNNKSFKYVVNGFSVHTGEGKTAHWKTYRLINNAWHLLDGENVTKIEDNDALKAAKYASSFILKHKEAAQPA